MAKNGYGMGAMMGVSTRSTPTGEVVGTGKRSPPKAGALRRLEIEIADNGGFLVTCYHKPSERSRNGGDIGYVEPTKSAFETRGSMIEYIEKKLGADEED